MPKTKPGAILKHRLAQSSELNDSEMIELPAGTKLITDGITQGHYRVIGYVWKDSLEIHDLHMNEAGLALIKKYEGLYLEAYQCGANVWTIGWGHTAGVKQGDRITKDEAESLLREDVRRFESGVKLQLKYLGLDESELNENQFSALVSLCFNCGLIPLNKDNTIGRSLVKRNYLAAADGFLLWRKAGGRVLKGLVRRRQEEKELFLS